MILFWKTTSIEKPADRKRILFHADPEAWVAEGTHIGYYDSELDRFVSVDEGGEDTINPMYVPCWMCVPERSKK